MKFVYEDFLELIGEKVVIIEYIVFNKDPYEHGSGMMIMKEEFYNKNNKKINRKLKDCELVSLYNGKLTDEVMKEYLGVEL